MSKILINNLVGIPASGKTNFCLKIIELVKATSHPINVVHICYDQFITIENASVEYLQSNQYKKDRFHISLLVEEIVNDILLGKGFKRSETMANIQFPQNCFKLQYNPLFHRYLLLIDDNMHYKSMRKVIKLIAMRNQVSYAVIYFPILLEIAIKRNNTRLNSIPENYLRKMYQQFDEPKSIDADYIILADIPNEPTLEMIDSLYKDLSLVQNQKEFIDVSPLEQSVLHKIDVMLRKEINRQMKNVYLKGSNCSAVAEVLCAKRKHLLNEIKNGNIAIPDDVNELNLYICN